MRPLSGLLEAVMDIDLEDLQGQPELSWDQLREGKTPETPSFAKRNDYDFHQNI